MRTLFMISSGGDRAPIFHLFIYAYIVHDFISIHQVVIQHLGAVRKIVEAVLDHASFKILKLDVDKLEAQIPSDPVQIPHRFLIDSI